MTAALQPEILLPSSLKKNYAFNLLSSILNLAFPLVSLTYLARIIGPENLGKFYFASGLVGYFVLGASLGIPMYGTRELAKTRGNRDAASKLCSELFLINLISSAAAGLLLIVIVAAIPGFHEYAALILTLGIMLISNFLYVDFIFLGYENNRNLAVRTIISKSIGLVLLFILVREPQDYFRYAFIVVIGHGIYNLTGILSSPVRLRFSQLNLRRHLKPLMLIFGLTMTVSAYVSLDSVMLGLLSNPESVGLYNVAIKTSRIAVLLLTSLGIVLIPRISFYLHQNMLNEYAVLAKKSVAWVYFLGMPISALLWILAPELIRLLFGEQYEAAITTLRLTSPLILLVGLTNFISVQILFPNGEERLVLIAAGTAAGLNVMLNLLLIPEYHHNGAAVATLLTEAVVLGVLVLVARRRYLTFPVFGKQALKYACLTVLMMGLILGVKPMMAKAEYDLYLAAGVGILGYIAALVVLKDGILMGMIEIVKRRIR